jgi:hypothetical protein
VGPFGDEDLLSVFWGAQGFGLGIPGYGVENPGVPAIGGHDVLSWARVGLLAAWRSRLATLRVKVTPAREMDACEAGMDETTLDGAERSGARAATMVREALPGLARESDSWRLGVGLSTR